jgi:hypothetical protein
LLFSPCGRPREGGSFEGLYEDAKVFLKGWKALEGFGCSFKPPLPENTAKTTPKQLKTTPKQLLKQPKTTRMCWFCVYLMDFVCHF